MQKTYCDDCGSEILLGRGALAGSVKLNHIGKEARIKLRFANSLGDDPDLCPDCAFSIAGLLREHVLLLKDKPEPEKKLEE